MKRLAKLLLLIKLTVGLVGCATIENESFSTIILNGEAYDLRTRTMTSANRSYVTHSVRIGGSKWVPCIPDSPGSCEAAIIPREFEREG